MPGDQNLSVLGLDLDEFPGGRAKRDLGLRALAPSPVDVPSLKKEAEGQC
jgi:hypothetical protein